MTNIYHNFNGEEIDIVSLSDKELVCLYRFLFGYCKLCLKISKQVDEDKEYKKYTEELLKEKDAINIEIKKRKLRIGSFKDISSL